MIIGAENEYPNPFDSRDADWDGLALADRARWERVMVTGRRSEFRPVFARVPGKPRRAVQP